MFKKKTPVPTVHYQKFESPLKFRLHRILKMAVRNYRGLYGIKYKCSNIMPFSDDNHFPMILTE